jgi:hypothetical protein
MRTVGGPAMAALAILLFAGCETAPATLTSEASPLSGEDDLRAIENPAVDLAAARPGVDWASFDKILVQDLIIPDEVLDTTPEHEPSSRTSLGESWVIPREDADKLAEEFREQVVKEFQSAGDIGVADAPGPGVLELQTQVVDIELSAPVEESRDPMKDVYSEEAGSMTIAGQLVDSESGEVVARFADGRYTTSMWQQNNRVRNMADARRLFREWAGLLHDGLANARAGGLSEAAG